MKVSSVALQTSATKKLNKIQLLPLTEDLLKVREFLKNEIPKLTDALNEKATAENWRYLVELVGIRLTMFNRRWISEVFGMLKSRFIERYRWKEARRGMV